jgi:hypothetical protein
MINQTRNFVAGIGRKLVMFMVTIFIFFSIPLFSQAANIFVDGIFQDWQALAPVYEDPIGDRLFGDLDFGRLWVTNTDRFLFFNIEVSGDINIQDQNEIALYLDTDNNLATGLQIHGIGAEFEWHFGPKGGVYHGNNQPLPVFHATIGLVTAPTVTSDQFEIAIDRDALLSGLIPLLPKDTLKIVFEDQGAGADILPNAGETLTYIFDPTAVPPLSRLTLQKQKKSHLRVLSYNVMVDGLFDPSRIPFFNRILSAIQPEIIGFQEIYSNTAEAAALQVELMLPSSGQQKWYSAKVDPDIIVVSRYSILNGYSIEGNGAFLIDLRPAYDSDLLLIVAHPPCCNNNEARQYEIDAIMAFVRDAKNPGGLLEIPFNTPIMLIGDMNLVGYAQQLKTLLRGEIVNNSQFGLSFDPDWDGSYLADLMPRDTGRPMFFTWYNEASIFHPGRLDFIIYTDSVTEPGNSFTLFTPAMSPESLSAYGLQKDDTILASDHLPVVGDFILPAETAVQARRDKTLQNDFILLQNYPNPFNPSTTIEFALYKPSKVTLKIYNILGEEVVTLVSGRLTAGRHRYRWDTSRPGDATIREYLKDGQNSGIYFFRMVVQEGTKCSVQTKAMLLLK